MERVVKELKEPLRCKFGLHTWNTWTEPVDKPKSDYLFTYQYRVCHKCGLVAERRVQ